MIATARPVIRLPIPGLIYISFGLLIGLLLRGGIDGNGYDDRSTPTPQETAAFVAAPTDSVGTSTPTEPGESNVMIIVTNTLVATEMPTLAPTSLATTDVHADDCDRITPSPKEGSLCRKPPGPTYTPTVPPLCPTAEPGKICSWVQA